MPILIIGINNILKFTIWKCILWLLFIYVDKDHGVSNWSCFHPKGQQKHGGGRFENQQHCELWVPGWIKILEYWKRHGGSQRLDKMATTMTKQTSNQNEPFPHKSRVTIVDR